MGPNYTKAAQILVWLGPAELVLVLVRPEEHGSDALMEAWQTEFCFCANTVFICGTKSVQVVLVMLAVQVLQFSVARLMETVYARAGVPFKLLNEVAEEPTARLFSCRQRRRKLDRSEEGAPWETNSTPSYANATSAAIPTPNYTNVGEAHSEVRMLTRAARAMITNPSTGRINILCYSQSPRPQTSPMTSPAGSPTGAATSARPFIPSTKPSTPTSSSPAARKPAISIIATGDAWDDTSWVAARYLRFFAQVDALFDHSLAITSTHPSKRPQFYPPRPRRREARWRVPIGDLFWTSGGGRMRRHSVAAAPPPGPGRVVVLVRKQNRKRRWRDIGRSA
ncbi:hypothetical protein N657DRAFT_694042 [Parathielavia appendiculata]|uniref:Uncharacterized protein n=1 Tax=Parathielavia appendiculata TaxID=2587402 RepID=A0AAN6TQV1_9PEZI|nr:hypothetical protein N657DRAFT_694042 [Parathielavia appendiculata]